MEFQGLKCPFLLVAREPGGKAYAEVAVIINIETSPAKRIYGIPYMPVKNSCPLCWNILNV
jgi:hypothetical protein